MTDLIHVEPNPASTKYPWRARYGDRILIAETRDKVLQLAWAVWGSNIAALVNT